MSTQNHNILYLGNIRTHLIAKHRDLPVESSRNALPVRVFLNETGHAAGPIQGFRYGPRPIPA
jgi:hypothetical protein